MIYKEDAYDVLLGSSNGCLQKKREKQQYKY